MELNYKSMPSILRLSLNCSVDFDHQIVRRSGIPYKLTDIEFRILNLLIERINEPVTTQEIINEIWSHNATGNKENLKVQIRKVRLKIETDPAYPKYLLSIHGIGYMMKSF